ESDRALYDSVLTRLKETHVIKGAAQNAIRTVSRALLPDRPIHPNKARVLLFSIFAGLVLGCSLCLGSTVLDNSLKTAVEAERRLGVPALGIIPNYSTMKSLTDGLA